MPQLRFLGHAGYSLHAFDVHLVIDPWIQGAAFDDGWDMLVPAVPFDPHTVTHLWFSHEHPDHFSVPSVKTIPKDRRGHVQVLFQQSNDKRVVTFLKGQGFTDVRDVRPGERVALAKDVALTTVPTVLDGDSCHLLEVCDFRMVNFNDCFYRSVSELEDTMQALGVTPGTVDLLASQFSYANWVGNPNEPEKRRAYARYKLDHLAMQVRTVKPKYALPFASYIYFSHEENAYLNDCTNPASRAAETVREASATPILMQPGDTLALSQDGLRAAAGLSAERGAALDAELAAVQRGGKPLRKSAKVPLEDLLTTIHAGLARLHSGLSRVDSAITRLQLPRAAFGLRDYPLVIVIEWLEKVSVRPATKETEVDVRVSSEALKFAFSNDFGFDTLLVNGRFEEGGGRGAVPIMKLCGQFGFVRRRQSLVRAILHRRVVDAPRRAIDKLTGRALSSPSPLSRS